MQVETFEVDEITTDQTEVELANLLIDKLGLTGQKNRKAPDGRQIRFRPVTHEENIIYKSLFPQNCKLEEFSAGPIPLRVLEAVERAKDDGIQFFTVYYPKEISKDPIIFGKVSDKWGEPEYLIARWGECLEEFPKLIKQWKEEAIASLNNVKSKIDYEINIIKGGNLKDVNRPTSSVYFYGVV